MRLALLFNQNTYLNNDNVPILAVEVVDDANTTAGAEITFTDPVSNIPYTKKLFDVAEDAYKKTLISNYSDCKFNKSAGTIVYYSGSPTNRAITDANYKKQYPMLIDQARLMLD